jgi:hypothetical protein
VAVYALGLVAVLKRRGERKLAQSPSAAISPAAQVQAR